MNGKSSRRINDVEAAKFLGLRPQTLRNWRSRGFGPPYYKLGKRRIAYDERELEAWLSSKRIDRDQAA